MLSDLMAEYFTSDSNVRAANLPWEINVAASEGEKRQRYDMILASCQGIPVLADNYVGVEPGAVVRLYLQRIAGNRVDMSFAEAKIEIVKYPKHGIATREEVVSPEFGVGFKYAPAAGYLGDDYIVYSVEVDGKRYLVNSKIRVMENFGEESKFCAGSTFSIKRVGSLSELGGSLEDWRKSIELSELLTIASGVLYS